MLDTKLATYATMLIKSVGKPIAYTDERYGFSQWKIQMDFNKHVRMQYGNLNFRRTNIITPADSVENMLLPHLTDEYSYAITMHELGHSIGRTTAELEAWLWAYNYSEVWTEEMQRAAREGLETYVEGGHFNQAEVDAFLTTLSVKGNK